MIHPIPIHRFTGFLGGYANRFGRLARAGKRGPDDEQDAEQDRNQQDRGRKSFHVPNVTPDTADWGMPILLAPARLATHCLGRERRCRKLLNRRSARAAGCSSVTVRYPGSLSDRARSGHGIDPQRMTAAPCRGWPASGPGRLLPGPWLLTGGVQRLRRSRVAEGHFRRKREAPLTVEGHPRTLSGPSLGLPRFDGQG
jgi:hypothetical protein